MPLHCNIDKQSSIKLNRTKYQVYLILFHIFRKYQTEYLQTKTEHKTVLSKELEVSRAKQILKKNPDLKSLKKLSQKIQ